MPELYVANCTKQDFNFTFKLPESKNKFAHEKVDIKAGGQILLRELSTPAINGIIEQYAPYGMREIKEVHRTRGFVGLAYSDREIVFDGISEAISHNMAILDETGKQLRADAAVEVDKSLLTTAPRGSELKATHVEVVENEHPSRPNTEINHRIKVEPEPGSQPRVGAVDPSRVR